MKIIRFCWDCWLSVVRFFILVSFGFVKMTHSWKDCCQAEPVPLTILSSEWDLLVLFWLVLYYQVFMLQEKQYIQWSWIWCALIGLFDWDAESNDPQKTDLWVNRRLRFQRGYIHSCEMQHKDVCGRYGKDKDEDDMSLTRIGASVAHEVSQPTPPTGFQLWRLKRVRSSVCRNKDQMLNCDVWSLMYS